jgi:hypothetical protein
MVITDHIGHAGEWDEVRIDGSIEDHDFLGYYLKDGQVLAMDGCGRDKQMCLATESMRKRELMEFDTMRQAMRSGRSVRV